MWILVRGGGVLAIWAVLTLATVAVSSSEKRVLFLAGAPSRDHGLAAGIPPWSWIRGALDQAEPEVVAMVKQRDLRGRLVVWFDWGVSIDGRRETVYTDPVMQKHLNFYYVPASRTAFLAETRPDHIWPQADLPVVSTLVADGWRPLHRGPRSVWLSRDGAPALPMSDRENGRRCFPGP
jgi:hypothetical protein